MRSSNVQFGVITLLPEILQSLNYGVTGRAIKNKLISLQCWNPRDYATDNYGTVDDKPYGGGPGMVMMVEPIRAAIHDAKQTLGNDTKVIYLSPQGQKFDHASAVECSREKKLIFLAGRYEGIDERLIELEVDEQWSIGDYVLTGGELAAAVMIDCITRLLSGALGDEDSAQQDSFVEGLLDHPHYTRPEVVAGLKVPEVLLGGDHKAIKKWRLQQALGNTWRYRPDLLENYELTNEAQQLLADFIKGEKQ